MQSVAQQQHAGHDAEQRHQQGKGHGRVHLVATQQAIPQSVADDHRHDGVVDDAAPGQPVCRLQGLHLPVLQQERGDEKLWHREEAHPAGDGPAVEAVQFLHLDVGDREDHSRRNHQAEGQIASGHLGFAGDHCHTGEGCRHAQGPPPTQGIAENEGREQRGEGNLQLDRDGGRGGVDAAQAREHQRKMQEAQGHRNEENVEEPAVRSRDEGQQYGRYESEAQRCHEDRRKGLQSCLRDCEVEAPNGHDQYEDGRVARRDGETDHSVPAANSSRLCSSSSQRSSAPVKRSVAAAKASLAWRNASGSRL